MSAEMKDRHSRMATSSVNQPMKKSGGGTANWGSAVDPATMYEPQGYGGSKIITAPAQYVTVAPAQYVVPQNNAQHFPTLGGAPMAQVQTVQWGPNAGAQPGPVVIQQQLEAQNRTGVVYDASHPRNTFAKKPYTSTVVGEVQAQQPMCIDWSQAGTQAIQQTMLHVAAHPTVHGQTPGVSVYPSTPLQVLQQQPTYVQQQQYQQPTHVQQTYAKPVYQKITQARGQ